MMTSTTGISTNINQINSNLQLRDDNVDDSVMMESSSSPIVISASTTTTTTTPSQQQTSIIMEYIEQHILMKYTGEALLQRLLHIILMTTTTARASSINTTTIDSSSNTNVDIQTLQSMVCMKYIEYIKEKQINVIRYKDFYQKILPLLQDPSVNVSSTNTTTTTDSINSSGVVPEYDQQWVNRMEQVIYNSHSNTGMNQTQSTSLLSYTNVLSPSSSSSTSTPTTSTTMNLSNQLVNMKDTLLLRLQTAQSHLNKDAIRIAYMNLALYYIDQYQLCISTTTNSNSNSNDTTTTASTAGNTINTNMNQFSPQSQNQHQHLYHPSLVMKYTLYYYNESMNMAMRSKEYCSTRYQTTIHTILILIIGLYMQNYNIIHDYVKRIEHNLIVTNFISTTTTNSTTTTSTPSVASLSSSSIDPNTILLWKDKVWTISGIERLCNASDYKEAAYKLRTVAMNISNRLARGSTNTNTNNNVTSSTTTSTDTTMSKNIETIIQDENWDRMVVSPEDIVMYAAVLTIAVPSSSSSSSSSSKHDTENTNKTIDNNNSNNMNIDERNIGLQFVDHPNMKSLFERVPIIYDILILFYHRCNYKKAYELLEQHIFPILQYDIYFQYPIGNGNNMNMNKNVVVQTHLQNIQNMIRMKCILLQWQAYQECPLQTMMDLLGNNGLTFYHNIHEFESYIIQLLKNRFHNMNSSNNNTTIGMNYKMSFPMDTRYDCIQKKLVRTYNPYSNSSSSSSIEQNEKVDEELQLYHTTVQLHRTATRVLDDTYSMLIRVSCIEHDIAIPAVGQGSFGNNNNNNNNSNMKSNYNYNKRRGGNDNYNNNNRNANFTQQSTTIQSTASSLQQHNIDDDDDDIDDEDDDVMIHDNDVHLGPFTDDYDDDDAMISNNAMNPEDMY